MKKYWDHVEIGDSLQQVAKAPISRIQIAQFAAAADDLPAATRHPDGLRRH